MTVMIKKDAKGKKPDLSESDWKGKKPECEQILKSKFLKVLTYQARISCLFNIPRSRLRKQDYVL